MSILGLRVGSGHCPDRQGFRTIHCSAGQQTYCTESSRQNAYRMSEHTYGGEDESKSNTREPHWLHIEPSPWCHSSNWVSLTRYLTSVQQLLKLFSQCYARRVDNGLGMRIPYLSVGLARSATNGFSSSHAANFTADLPEVTARPAWVQSSLKHRHTTKKKSLAQTSSGFGKRKMHPPL